MLAIPVAILSVDVADSSKVAVTNGSLPMVSGIHSVGNPSSSMRCANRCDSADGTVSSTPVQIPTLPMSIVFPAMACDATRHGEGGPRHRTAHGPVTDPEHAARNAPAPAARAGAGGGGW